MNVFSQYLWAGTLDQYLAHVEDGAQGLDVVPLPQSDRLGKDLQLQLLALPHFLTLGLVGRGERRGGGQRATHSLKIIKSFCLRTLEVRSCQVSSPTGFWRRPCTCVCLAGQGDSPADTQKAGYGTNVIKEGLRDMSGYQPPCASPALWAKWGICPASWRAYWGLWSVWGFPDCLHLSPPWTPPALRCRTTGEHTVGTQNKP